MVEIYFYLVRKPNFYSTIQSGKRRALANGPYYTRDKIYVKEEIRCFAFYCKWNLHIIQCVDRYKAGHFLLSNLQ